MPWKKVRLSGQRGYWALVDENNEPIDLDENGNVRVYDAPDGKQVALGEQIKPAYITRERDDKFAAQERARQIDEKARNSGAWRFANAISYAPYAAALPIAAEVAPTFAPGSPFWMNPITQRMIAGTAMTNGIDAITKLGTNFIGDITKTGTGYNSWEEGVSDLVNKATGWNPHSSWWGQFLAGATNPGWGMNPSRIMNPIGKVGNAIEIGVNKAMTLYNSPLTGKWTTIGGQLYRLSPAAGANHVALESNPATALLETTIPSNRTLIVGAPPNMTSINKILREAYNRYGRYLDEHELLELLSDFEASNINIGGRNSIFFNIPEENLGTVLLKYFKASEEETARELGRRVTVNGEVINNALPEEFAQRGWEAKKPITVNGKETLLVWHPEYGYTSLEEATGEVGRGTYANLVTNEALDAYNPAIRADASNGTFLDQLRSIARKIDRGKETPADIKNTSEYEYPRIWDLILKTSLGKQEYPNGATMVSRGLWPGSSTTAKSPNYDALFTGYNRDMAMPYVRIGQNLGGKNNFGLPLYEKYFSKEKVELLRNIDRQIEELITTKGYYNQEDSGLLQRLHNLRSTLLGDKLPEFGGLQLLLVPNKANGEMLNTVMPRGLAMEHSTFGDLGAGNPIYISKLAGDTGFYDANAVSGALASEGPANNIYGVWLHSHSPEFTGIHDKGVGSTLIWNLDGFAPFLKSVHGNSFKNLSGSIESAYRKGGKFLKNTK